MEPNENTEKVSDKQEQSLNDFLKKYSSIEALWKDIEKKKNDTKANLRKAEERLVDSIKELKKVIGKLNDDDEKKTSYDGEIKKAYGNNLKGAEKFIEKFPNWSIAIGLMFSASPHYQRICQSAAKDRKYKDITKKSNFELKRTGKGKIKGDGILNKIKSGWKSLKTAFSNYIKPDDIGKASKSSLARRIKKFGEEINRPWRMWWEFAAGEKSKLSKDEAKATFKEELKKGKAEDIVRFFNYGLGTEKSGHELCIVEDNDGGYTGNKGFMYMNTVIEDLDKNLLKTIQAVFNVDDKTVKTNIENSAKITASKIFQDDKRKPEDYEKFFSILGIEDYYGNNKSDDNAIINQITELLKEIEGEGKLSELAGNKNANIIKFIQLARANYVIKNNKMEEKSAIIANLENIMKILDVKGDEVKGDNLLNEKGNDLGGNTKKIIEEIEKNWDKEIAKKFKDAINNILAPTDKQLANIEAAQKALGGITTDVNQRNKLTTEDEVAKAIEAIKTCKDLTDETNKSGCRYNAKNGRKEFLVDVAVRLGVRGITENNIQDLCKSKANLKPPYDRNTGAQLVQKLRNLIGYGLGYGTSKMSALVPGMNDSNSLPNIDDKDIVRRICGSLKISTTISTQKKN